MSTSGFVRGLYVRPPKSRKPAPGVQKTSKKSLHMFSFSSVFLSFFMVVLFFIVHPFLLRLFFFPRFAFHFTTLHCRSLTSLSLSLSVVSLSLKMSKKGLDRWSKIIDVFKKEPNVETGGQNVLVIDVEVKDPKDLKADILAVGMVLATTTPGLTSVDPSRWTLVDGVQYIINPIGSSNNNTIQPIAPTTAGVSSSSTSTPIKKIVPPTKFWRENEAVYEYFCNPENKMSSQDVAGHIQFYLDYVYANVPKVCLLGDDPATDYARLYIFLQKHGYRGLNFDKDGNHRHFYITRDLSRGIMSASNPIFLDLTRVGLMEELKKTWLELRAQLDNEAIRQSNNEKEATLPAEGTSFPELLNFEKQFQDLIKSNNSTNTNNLIMQMRRHIPVVDAFQTVITYFQARDIVRMQNALPHSPLPDTFDKPVESFDTTTTAADFSATDQQQHPQQQQFWHWQQHPQPPWQGHGGQQPQYWPGHQQQFWNWQGQQQHPQQEFHSGDYYQQPQQTGGSQMMLMVNAQGYPQPVVVSLQPPPFMQQPHHHHPHNYHKFKYHPAPTPFTSPQQSSKDEVTHIHVPSTHNISEVVINTTESTTTTTTTNNNLPPPSLPSTKTTTMSTVSSS